MTSDAMRELIQGHIRQGAESRKRDAETTARLAAMGEQLLYANAAPLRDKEKAQAVSEQILDRMFEATKPE